jgi:membrane fusion protein, multidrug efflux system
MTDETGPVHSDETPQGGGIPRWVWGGGLAVAAIAGVAAFSGGGNTTWSDSKAGETAKTQAVAEAAKTEAAKPKVVAEPDIRGVIKAKQESTVASKMTARIVSMPFDKGESFRRGALLASFDCSSIRAQLNAARAATNAYSATYKTNVELDQYQAVGKNEVIVAKANLGKAQAEANAIGTQLSDCAVYAPFSGTVVDQVAHRGEVAASGQPLLKIQIDETGSSISGAITQLGASVDPVSKTIRVTGSVGAAEGLVLPGMSGSAVFDRQSASKTPPAIGASNGRKPG